MGHLNIVTEDTLENIFEDGCISVRANLGKQYYKTIADIFSDILTLREDDYIFPWITSTSQGAGFQYIFKVKGPPVYIYDDPYPIKVPLKKDGFKYDFLPESKAVNLWRKKLLWNIIGKKSLGRGKGITHQTQFEDEELIKMMENNSSNRKTIKLDDFSYGEGQEITIDPAQNGKAFKEILQYDEKNRISKIDIQKMKWTNKNGEFRVEKGLEAWMTENIGKAPAREFKEIALEKDMDIAWFGNYLPFGVQGGNIDLVIIQSSDEKYLVKVIELKVGSLSNNDYLGASAQAREYSKYIKKALNAYEIDVVTVEPIVLSAYHDPRGRITEDCSNLAKWVMYKIIDEGEVKFKIYDPT